MRTKMGYFAVLLLLIGCITSVMAEDNSRANPLVLTYNHLIHPSLSEMSFEIPRVLSEKQGCSAGEGVMTKLIIRDRAKGLVVQEIPLEMDICLGDLEFKDLNDDGYIDMVVYLAQTPYSYLDQEAWIYAPKLKRFVKSKTLSNIGEITKSEKHGCVEVMSKCSYADYIIEEWCFNLEKGRWKMNKRKQECQIE